VYSSSDNGTNPGTTNPNPADLTNRGESAVKLTPSGNNLTVASFFTPSSYYNMDTNDLDYGVMGTFLVPGTNDYLTGCKDGNIYLLNKDNMGGFSAAGNQVLQTVPLNVTLHCQPAFYAGAVNTYIYVWSENDQLRAFTFNGGRFAANPIVSNDQGPMGDCGADLSVSSNGTTSGTAILWATYALYGDASTTDSPGVLRAFDATDISNELWNSSLTSGDNPGNYAKFCAPTIANGHVYVATFSNKVVVYGLK
jgi:outer membrane protein assembly factor BamB